MSCMMPHHKSFLFVLRCCAHMRFTILQNTVCAGNIAWCFAEREDELRLLLSEDWFDSCDSWQEFAQEHVCM